MNAILLSVITFVSCTECPKDIRGFLDVPAGEQCDMVKWKLEILDNGAYTVNAQWGYYVDNRTFKYTGELANARGTYKVSNTSIYTLSNNNGSMSLMKLNANMFHLLDKSNKILPGGEGYANILNRVDAVEDKSINFLTPNLNKPKENFILSGRTPLKPFDKELPIVDNEDHQKIKWLIKFSADGTVKVREILEHIKDWEGTWTVQDNIYQLKFEGRTLSLAKLSDDVYVFVSKNGGLITGDHEFGSALMRRSPSGR